MAKIRLRHEGCGDMDIPAKHTTLREGVSGLEIQELEFACTSCAEHVRKPLNDDELEKLKQLSDLKRTIVGHHVAGIGLTLRQQSLIDSEYVETLATGIIELDSLAGSEHLLDAEANYLLEQL